MFTTMDDEGEISMVAEPSPDFTYTYADYLNWKFEERLELFKGKIFKMADTTTKHQLVAGKLYLRIGSYLKKQPHMVFIAPYDVRLTFQNSKWDNEMITVLQPDLGIVCDLAKIDDKGVIGMPDFVVEILVPGDSSKEIKLKHELYQEAGVGEYWIICPSCEYIITYRLNNKGELALHKILTDGDIVTLCAVPGLQIDIADIFDN